MENVVSLDQRRAAKSHAAVKTNAKQIQKDVYTTIVTALQELGVDLAHDPIAYKAAAAVCIAFTDVAIDYHTRHK
jgi:hypothetical protein